MTSIIEENTSVLSRDMCLEIDGSSSESGLNIEGIKEVQEVAQEISVIKVVNEPMFLDDQLPTLRVFDYS